jgi:DNA gyrase subunit B
VRKRPAVIFGSDGIEGCEYSFFEILSNSINEARAGYGKEINVTVSKDGVMTVEDFGRGVPLDWNEELGKYNWFIIFCELYTGAKRQCEEYNNYIFSLGLEGVGACVTQYVSEFMEVIAFTNGEKLSVKFKKGEPAGELEREPCPKDKTGTFIKWKADKEVFTDTDIPLDYFKTLLEKQATLNKGIKFTLEYEMKNGDVFKEEYFYNEETP